jgi:uncharacterized repeat protein (TIGR01451 family)
MVSSGRPPAHPSFGGQRRGTALAFLLTLLLALTGLAWTAAPAAQAAPVYQITGAWAPGTPTTVKSGDVVTGVWRVNVNDDQSAPANDPVDNVTFTVTLQHGLFKALPDACLTGAAVDPPSSISPDGRTLTCDLGTQKEGTADVVQAPMTVDGDTGDEVSATGTIAGQTVTLPPLNIVNPFGMDIAWGSSSSTVTYNANSVDTDLEWTLFLNAGSSPGPDTVLYHLNVTTDTGAAVAVAPDACSAFTTGGASEHPWSGGSHPASQLAPFVGSCSLSQTGPNTFDLTLSGIDYSQAKVPTQDSVGQALPTDRVAIASGSVWFRVTGTQNDSIRLSSNAPAYTAPTGGSANDDPANNTADKVWTRGGWTNAYRPEFSNVQVPSWWSNQFRVSPGTLVDGTTNLNVGTAGHPATDTFSQCVIMDTKYVTFHDAQFSYNWASYEPDTFIPGSTVEYYVGTNQYVDPNNAGYDPNSFACADDPGGWTTTEPADLSTVKAVRVSYPFSVIDGSNNAPLMVHFTINPDTPIGTDVWEFGELEHNGVWDRPSRTLDANGPVPTPGKRYPYVGSGRDVLYVIGATPAISKSVDRTTVRPGTPATYTLTYSANGSGAIPAKIDNYQIVDTLPPGMTYVSGSAQTAPSVSTNGAGRQVLTWNLDAVPTNTSNTLTYQAVPDTTVTPGQALTNSVTASVDGQTSAPATAQVTVSTNGYTTIAKTADEPFIPNLDGNGNGSGSWTVSLRSFDPLPQPYTDTIDILPYRGDGRGTAYSGSYTLGTVTAVNGATIYCTTQDPSTLSDDPGDAANGTSGGPVSNIWSTTCGPDATAVRVIGPALAPGAEQQFTVPVTTHGAKGGDVLVNRAQGRAGHTELVMRTSAPITVANYYSAALKKYVQDREGVWHDANDAADYPTFQYGDTINYRVVLTNTGQGTLTNIDVSDDKQPTLGAFHVGSLEPGKSVTHTYSIVLDKSTVGTVVNTASATADTPPDSHVPPTIPSDPGGFQVVNYTTVKTANPASHTAVEPGQRITYTIKVTQAGPAPAQAQFSDDLTKILDDARYDGDVKASLGTARIQSNHLIWSGTVPVGGTATVTYSVTVRGVNHLGDADLVNPVTSPGCVVKAGETLNCDTANPVGRYDLVVHKKVVGSHVVTLGNRVHYQIRVKNNGPDAATAPITLRDPMPHGLQLKAVHGRGWDCTAKKSTDVAKCTYGTALAAGQKAPPVTVVAKTTRTALGRHLNNVATIASAGDTVKSNNHDHAKIRVAPEVALPNTGFRRFVQDRVLL